MKLGNDEAKKICPDVVIVLGEDLTRFRDASKELYNFLSGFSWNGRVERLGFDEVFFDATDTVDYNLGLINQHDLSHSFFCLSKEDPIQGFSYDASKFAGHVFGHELWEHTDPRQRLLGQRLILGSHFARFLRLELEEQKGYSATLGISTNKVLSKLIGNLNKPKGQTTLLPPYEDVSGQPNNINAFLDSHEIGKIPGVGFKMAQKLRQHILGRPPALQEGLITFNVKDNVTVGQVREHPDMKAPFLEKLLSGPGSPHGIGTTVWNLLHGIDDAEVAKVRDVPRQISIEDSYIRLNTLDEVRKQLGRLATSLIKRMHADLVEVGNSVDNHSPPDNILSAERLPHDSRRWLAHPRTLRLSTRARPAANPDGSRSRSFNRVSRSCPVPNYLYNLHENADALVDRLVTDTLMPLFRKIHPEKSGWDLSLLNVAVTNMTETAGCGRSAKGRDIGTMFRNQEDVLKEWIVEDRDMPPDHVLETINNQTESETLSPSVEHSNGSIGQEDHYSQMEGLEAWDSDDESNELLTRCSICNTALPLFAMDAHLRYHEVKD